MRVLSFIVIIGAAPAVHNAIMARNLDFKKSFFRNISNVATQGIVGITLAYMGFGVWALVFSKLSGTFVGAKGKQMTDALVKIGGLTIQMCEKNLLKLSKKDGWRIYLRFIRKIMRNCLMK